MRVNEIFYSIQGEGYWAGFAFVFIRFSGCNLKCSFCDTDHEEGTEMTVKDIMTVIKRFLPCRMVVLTGGEPMLQVTAGFTKQLHREGYKIHIETNGSVPIPKGVTFDWVTCSPKVPPLRIDHAEEIKLVYDGVHGPEQWMWLPSIVHSIQPMVNGDPEHDRQVTEATLQYVLEHPSEWRLSVQLHKYLGIR